MTFQKRIRNLCGLFVSIKDSKVYLIHQTAKEFLVSGNYILQRNVLSNSATACWEHAFPYEESNLILGTICMWLLLSTDYDNIRLQGLSIVIQNYRFLEYAAKTWALHLRRVKCLTPASLELSMILCDPESRSFSLWYLMLNHEDPTWRLTSLGVAASLDLCTVVKQMLQGGAAVNAMDGFRRTALMRAVEDRRPREGAERVEIVRLLLESGASVGLSDERGITALHIACQKNHPSVVALLLEYGAPIDATNKSNRTPLHDALLERRAEIVEQLLNAGADVKARTGRQDTALGKAASDAMMPKSNFVLELIISKGADVNGRGSLGKHLCTKQLKIQTYRVFGHFCVRKPTLMC